MPPSAALDDGADLEEQVRRFLEVPADEDRDADAAVVRPGAQGHRQVVLGAAATLHGATQVAGRVAGLPADAAGGRGVEALERVVDLAVGEEDRGGRRDQ